MPTHTIAENLQRLVSAKSAIASAIVSKGGSVSVGDGFEAFPSAINALGAGGIVLDPMESPDDIDKIISKTISGTYTNSCIITLKSYALYGCSSLRAISLPNCSFINNYAFGHCSALSSAYFLSSSVCNIIASTVFWSTGIKSNAGKIYVPASLANIYKSTTNWAYFSSIIAGI